MPDLLTETDALAITLTCSEAFSHLPTDLPSEYQRGAMLLYSAIMTRVKPLLRKDDPRLALVHVQIAVAEGLAAQVRDLLGYGAAMHTDDDHGGGLVS